MQSRYGRYNPPMTYTCKVCGVTDDADEFYKGVTSRCKECHKAKVKENRQEKADYYKQYDAYRFKNDPKVKARHKRYQSTPSGKDAMRKARWKWINKKPEARAAHIILGNAVRDGMVIKPKICTNCGCTPKKRNMHAHHHDYSLPLDVTWLCSECHYKTHKETE